MKSSKDENMVASTVKTTAKYAFFAPGALGKGRGREIKSLCSLGVSKNDIPISPSVEKGVVAKGRGRSLRSMCSFGVSKNQVESFHNNAPYAGQTPSNSIRSDCTMSTAQGMRSTNKNPLVPEKGNVQNNIPTFSSTAEVMQYIQTVNGSALGKERTPSSMCSFEESENEKESFHQNNHSTSMPIPSNSTTSNSTMFAAQGLRTKKPNSLVHEKPHMQSDNPFFPSTDQVLQCSKTVETSASGKRVKDHFYTESFQARTNRNAANRAKLKMLHHIGSEAIREIIYEKGGKDGKPPDLATIFFETRKKNNILVDSEAIEKHAQLQELVQSEPSLPNIEIIEKCFGPQTRSHVFGFGGGVKAKDLKGGIPSKAKLLSELRSTQEENQSLKDRLSNVENEMKEMKQLKEWVFAQYSNF